MNIVKKVDFLVDDESFVYYKLDGIMYRYFIFGKCFYYYELGGGGEFCKNIFMFLFICLDIDYVD